MMKISPLFSLRCVAAGLLLVTAATAPAAVYATYDASLPTPDPLTQGWGLGNTPVGPAPSAGSEVINGTTHHFWQLSNRPPASEPFALVYRQNFTATEYSDPAGWTVSATLRVARAPYAATYGHNVRLRLADGVSDWHFNIYYTATSGGGVLHYVNASQTNTDLALKDTASDYFTFQFYFNPATQMVQAYYNGEAIGSPITRAQVATATGSRYLMWGDADNSNRGTSHYTDTWWKSVQFESGYAVVPEPGTVALGVAGGAVLLLWRRRR